MLPVFDSKQMHMARNYCMEIDDLRCSGAKILEIKDGIL